MGIQSGPIHSEMPSVVDVWMAIQMYVFIGFSQWPPGPPPNAPPRARNRPPGAGNEVSRPSRTIPGSTQNRRTTKTNTKPPPDVQHAVPFASLPKHIAGRRADVEALPTRIQPKSGPEARFLARTHSSVTQGIVWFRFVWSGTRWVDPGSFTGPLLSVLCIGQLRFRLN